MRPEQGGTPVPAAGAVPAVRRKLDRLDRAREPRDLTDPPGNRLEV